MFRLAPISRSLTVHHKFHRLVAAVAGMGIRSGQWISGCSSYCFAPVRELYPLKSSAPHGALFHQTRTNQTQFLLHHCSRAPITCMADWLESWRKRQHAIAEGTDADLVQANRTRFRVAFSLVGVGFILMVLGGKLHLTGRLDTVLRVIAAVSVVVGFVLGRWARSEREFLTRPEPEGPPEIFRDKGRRV